MTPQHKILAWLLPQLLALPASAILSIFCSLKHQLPPTSEPLHRWFHLLEFSSLLVSIRGLQTHRTKRKYRCLYISAYYHLSPLLKGKPYEVGLFSLSLCP